MKTLRDSVYVLVAVGSLGLAVCQPPGAGVEHATEAVDSMVTQLADALQPSATATAR